MNKLNEYFKKNHKPKNFTHKSVEKQAELQTQTIKGKRFYVLPNGEKLPSITTVLSARGNEGIARWRQSVGEQVANTIMRNAAKRGTAVHTLTENYLNNEELTQQAVLPTALFTILKSELDKINNIVMQEGALYSNKWGVAGRVDCIAEYDGKFSVLDFKTSTKHKKEEWVENYFIQTSAYCEMFEERYGKSIDQNVIFIVTEEGSTQTFVKNKKE
jgi:genome maintenance exonuclease 1